MDLSSLLDPESRIIDVGPADTHVASTLASQGRQRYLGLVAPERLGAVRSQSGALAQRFHPMTSMSASCRNNADLLILRSSSVQVLWAAEATRHVRYVAVAVGRARIPVEAAAGIAMGRVRRKLRPLGFFTCGSERFLVLRAPGRRPLRPRQYLSPVHGVEGFIRRAEAAGLTYAALRWFEQLPEMEPGEDLDLLVADEDLDTMRALLAEEPGTIPVDLYSVTGLTGADYQGAAYYPPALAQALLERAVRHQSGCMVPSPQDHLRSLAYHAAYHKGHRSGLSSAVFDERHHAPEHDYEGALTSLATTVGVELEATLEGVDEYLNQQGWRPPLDALRRLAPSNPWIVHRFLRVEEPRSDEPETVAFLLRERARTVLSLEEIDKELDHLGFDVVAVRELDAAARARCEASARGGNWARGPFALSGGGPVVMIVALHHGPRPPRPFVQARYPHLTNMDVLLVKRRIRELVAERLPPPEQFNAIHSSDNEAEAWEYIALGMDDAEKLRADIDARKARYRSELPVVRHLSRGRRSRVEVVDSVDGPVVRKTFADRYRRHMEREIEGIRVLGPHVPEVTELVETGPNWFTTTYYQNTLEHTGRDGRLVPLPAVRQMVAVLRRIHDLGFDVVDAKPQNFLLDPEHGLKIVDLEYLHRYDGDRPAFADSYSFVGVPEGFTGDVPLHWSYDWRWRRSTGLSRGALVGGSPLRQHLERVLFRVRWATTGPESGPRNAGRQLRDNLRTVRGGALSRYDRWATHRLDGEPPEVRL